MHPAMKTHTLHPPKRRSAAFSMIEISVAMVVVGVGIVSLLGVMPLLLRSDRAAIEYTDVAMAAQDYIETRQYTLYTPNDLDAQVSNTNFLFNSGAGFFATNVTTSTVSSNTLYTREFQLSVTYPDGTAHPTQPLLKTMRVIYAWPPKAVLKQTNIFMTEVAATRDIPCQ
jgi:Tfp pilus assembly protein PilV